MKKHIKVKQRDMSDCGPACLASVFAHHGRQLPVSKIRQVCRTDARGTSMFGLMQALLKFGFEARALKGESRHLSSLPLPWIAHVTREDGIQHYLVVYRKGKNRLRVMDPEYGKILRVDLDTFEKQWSGAALVMQPSSTLPAGEQKSTHLPYLKMLIRPVWKALVLALTNALLYTVLGLSTSLYIGKITDHVLVNGNLSLLNLMSMAMLLIALCMVLLSTGRNMLMLRSGQVIDNQLIMSYYRYLFNLPQRFFNSMQTGEIISRISDAIKIRSFINDAAIGIMVQSFTLITAFTAMYIIEARLALLMSIFLPLYSLLYLIFNRLNRIRERRVMEQAAKLEDHLVESLGASAHIRQENLIEINREKTERRFNVLLDQLYLSGKNSIIISAGSESINRLFTILLLWLGSFMVINNDLSPGKLLSFYALIAYCTGPVGALLAANKTYQNARIAADRLLEIFDLDREERSVRPDFSDTKLEGIEVRDLVFSYGSRGNQLAGLSLKLCPGSISLISGGSGSGKSTLAAVLAFMYPPDGGHIYINGCDSSLYSKKSLRRLVGFVPQQQSFLHGSLLENLAPGDKQADLERIFSLIRSLGLIELVEKLPGGLHTRVGSRGINFSGGEKQRLGLVRALYRNPPLLILDEPASALDEVSETCLNRLLLSLREAQKTIVLISHKQHYRSIVDQHLVMDAGRIKEVHENAPLSLL